VAGALGRADDGSAAGDQSRVSQQRRAHRAGVCAGDPGGFEVAEGVPDQAEITDLAADVTLWASTSKSEEDPVGTFSFKIASIGPNESKDLTEPLKTKLKMYEMPDWQNATTDIQITAPTQ